MSVVSDDTGEITIAGKIYWTDARLARELNRHTRTIARWHEAGIAPPHLKVAGLPRLYDPDRLPGWLAEFEVQPVRAGRGRRRTAA